MKNEKSISIKSGVSKVITMATFTILNGSMALCDNWGAGTQIQTDNLDAAGAVGNLIGVVITLAMYVGIALAAWGGVMFGLAVKNEEPESKQKALMTIIAGFVLLSLKPILQAINIVQ